VRLSPPDAAESGAALAELRSDVDVSLGFAADVVADARASGHPPRLPAADETAVRSMPALPTLVSRARVPGRAPKPPHGTPAPLVDVRELATYLSVEPSWVYEHAAELGARRLGTRPKARRRFDLAEVDERLRACPGSREECRGHASALIGPGGRVDPGGLDGICVGVSAQPPVLQLEATAVHHVEAVGTGTCGSAGRDAASWGGVAAC
jgi:hypothetical protein